MVVEAELAAAPDDVDVALLPLCALPDFDVDVGELTGVPSPVDPSAEVDSESDAEAARQQVSERDEAGDPMPAYPTRTHLRMWAYPWQWQFLHP